MSDIVLAPFESPRLGTVSRRTRRTYIDVYIDELSLPPPCLYTECFENPEVARTSGARFIGNNSISVKICSKTVSCQIVKPDKFVYDRKSFANVAHARLSLGAFNLLWPLIGIFSPSHVLLPAPLRCNIILENSTIYVQVFLA